ncbi:hypothetical protein M9Y10_043023 [Tritrichomonas musculus]|uniref:Uncharacterized protein n=1 Tax=Tritrichomonas musculus TaxID=1915356 RepID=A0ABR2JYV9_9EUKA
MEAEQNNDENNAHKMEIKKNRAVIASMMATMEGLKKIISDQDGMIKNLLTNVKNQNTEIDKLNAIVGTRGELIAKMKNKIDSLTEQNEILNRNIIELKAEKDKLETDKNQKIDELNKQIAELQEQIKGS